MSGVVRLVFTVDERLGKAQTLGLSKRSVMAGVVMFGGALSSSASVGGDEFLQRV